MGDDWSGHAIGNTNLSGPLYSSKSKSAPEQAAKVAFRADAVVVGSAIVRRMEEHGKDPAFVRQIADFVRPLAEAIHGARR